MAYTPPTGDNLLFVFAAAYTPPDGDDVLFVFTEAAVETQYASPAGFDSLEMGEPPVVSTPRQVISNFTPIAGNLFGTPKVGPERIAPSGFDSLLVGHPADADHAIRYRYFAGIDSLVFGTTKIGTTQTVTFIGLPYTLFGNWLIGRHSAYQMTGFDSSEFGIPTVDYRRLIPLGFTSTLIGEHTIKLGRSVVDLADNGVPPAGTGNHDIRLARRYVFPPSLVSTTDLTGGSTEYGVWKITGPDGPIFPLGLDFLRIGITTHILLKGVGLRPTGIAPPEMPAHQITHWVQYVTPTGSDTWQGPDLTLQVRNAALAAYPVGFDSLSVSEGLSIKDALQTAAVIMPALTEYGTAMIAYRIRTIVQLPTADPDRPPKFIVYSNNLEAQGVDSLRTGLPIVVEHFNRAIPFGIPPPEQNQQHAVRNRNREYLIPGETHTAFGLARVWTNKLQLTGLDTLEFSPSSIADRTGRVFPPAWESLRADPFHIVRHEPAPPLQQEVEVFGFDASDFERPDITNGSVVFSGFDSLGMDPPTIILMGLSPKGWLDTNGPEAGFGTPFLTFGQSIQFVGIKPLDAFGDPRISPYYIVAPDPNHPVDADTNIPQMGFPEVNYFHRSLRPTGIQPFNEFGVPRIELTDRRVYFGGIYRFVAGTPKMGGGISSYEWAKGVTHTVFGPDTTISHIVPYSPFVSPEEFEATQFGIGTEISLKNRQVYPIGIAEPFWPQIFSPSGVYHTPLSYGPFGNYLGTVWGQDTFIAHRNRSIQMIGFDSLNMKSSPPQQGRVTKIPSGTDPFHALR